MFYVLRFMNKTCKNCKQTFEIAPDDATFYEKVNVPAPRFCPPCRTQRRLLHRNERTLYRRPCDRCGADGVSIYPVGTPWPVYCNPCWWGDAWDGKSFGMEYNPAKSFFDQYRELLNKVPRINLLCITSVNSEYTNNSADNKNCYLLFAAEKNQDCMYGRLVQGCKSVVDCSWTYDSESCYECVDVRQSFGCLFCERCQTGRDLLFCYDVRDSQNCILSTNLRHASYRIENKQCTKEEYEAKKKEILASQESIEAAKKRFEELKAQAIVKYAFQTKCNDATGDYLYNVHHSRMMFDASNAKDCSYMADVEDPTDCLDGNNMYYRPERCLDVMGTLQTYNCKFSTYAMYCSSVEYSDSLQNCQDCFGSIGLKKAQYCILNKQYTKEEYDALVSTIKAQMTKPHRSNTMRPWQKIISPIRCNPTSRPEPMEKKTGGTCLPVLTAKRISKSRPTNSHSMSIWAFRFRARILNVVCRTVCVSAIHGRCGSGSVCVSLAILMMPSHARMDSKRHLRPIEKKLYTAKSVITLKLLNECLVKPLII